MLAEGNRKGRNDRQSDRIAANDVLGDHLAFVGLVLRH
jgi:predicted RNA-binding protein